MFNKCIVATLLYCAVLPAWSWESDVHYGLTQWLALKAGFTPEEAGWIAKGDESVDESPFTNPVVQTMLSSCVASSDTGAAGVRRNHFPAEVSPPAPPADRHVVPGKVWDGGIRTPHARPIQRSQFQDLGAYLHALQDSWSHQGIPDTPEPCSDQLGWGHAVSRGGWTCHLADLTYKWADRDLLPMAQSTFEALTRASTRKGARWEDLTPAVMSFARARSINDKTTWFLEQKIRDTSFLQGSSLPTCADPSSKSCQSYVDLTAIFNRWQSTVLAFDSTPSLASTLVSAFFKRFLDKMVGRDDRGVREMMDLELAAVALAKSLHVAGSCEPLLAASFSAIVGEAFYDGRGGQTPLNLCEAAIALRNADEKLSCGAASQAVVEYMRTASRRGPGLGELIRKDFRSYVFSVQPSNSKDKYIAVARFPHYPRDRLVLAAQERNGELKIVSAVWAPQE
ncbi:hypothetical protein H4CHR_00166 [Variovorax sp. PBS-H4]|uniref:hypothetical protein n=1 Tax=Variovorax sp. PBS-H4 TaxID=434008 RepID=UPI001317C254|nr:hypothetical protein [Variovorax sp. PBS-H4]VTU18341.1 hypothetical protein H4CHR_00166 [Variovorax sp. PBS-H4]